MPKGKYRTSAKVLGAPIHRGNPPVTVEQSARAGTSPHHGGSAWLLLLFSPALLASNMLVSRIAAGWVPPYALTFWRWLLTGLLLVATLFPHLLRNSAALKREWKGLLVLGAIGMTVCGSASYLAGESTTTVNIALIYAASPVLMTLLARAMLEETLTAARIAGIVLCILGVGAIVARGEPESLLHLQFNRGDLWALFGSLGWALFSFLQVWIRSDLPGDVRLAAMALAGALVAAPFTLVEASQRGGLPFTGEGIALLSFTVLVSSWGSYKLYARFQQVAGVSFAGMAAYVAPLWAALYGWVFMSERLQGYHLAGAALILPGIWLARSVPRTKPEPPIA